MNLLRSLLAICILLVSMLTHATPSQLIEALANSGREDRLELVAQLAATGDTALVPLFQHWLDSELYLVNGRLVIATSDGGKDAITGKSMNSLPDTAEQLFVNNRVRTQLGNAIAILNLNSPDVAKRLAAARQLVDASDSGAAKEQVIETALAKETDSAVKALLTLIDAKNKLKDANPSKRILAIRNLSDHGDADTRPLVAALLEKDSAGQYLETDRTVRIEARKAIQSIDNRMQVRAWVGNAFFGLSLASILLLAALGLAISFGLMGIINMAHGELLMLGAYTTYLIQNLFRAYLPESLDWYLLVAIPAAFLLTAAIGMALERGILRHLYGRPLETLLATWGLSLILIQMVRSLFGAQNVEVSNPGWMSGGIMVLDGLVLPYNRIVIIFFAVAVLVFTWFLLNRTRLGLFVRAVTQNRTMAACVGVPTGRVDMYAFGLGAGIAGLGGVALSQIGNVGPELGQSYIVDSFMVVVLGGVGQLAGTVIAALGLGEVNKFLEPWTGAVLAKIAVLVFIIIFIQKRPQGLFALKGRNVEN